jgi:hypothetical protein
LIPASGIKGVKEQEQGSTSALLAVMQAVPSFGKALLSPLGAPPGRITTFIEPHFNVENESGAVPDGAIVVERGAKRWTALVEVKTGDSVLDSAQVARYVQIAAAEGFEAVLTISNQIVASPTDSPVQVDGRILKKLALRHPSWFSIMTEAIIQSEHSGIADSNQAWILRELIAFLDDERSGAGGFEGMGKTWVTVRDAARMRTLSPGDKEVRAVAEGWEQFLEYLALRLRQSLGNPVSTIYPKASDPKSRLRGYIQSLSDEGRLVGSIRIPDAAAPIEIEAHLASVQTTTSVRLVAPKEGKAKTRITWLIRQLTEAPDDVRIEVSFAHLRTTTSALLGDVRKRPELLLHPEDLRREPMQFEVALTRNMGIKRGKGSGSFVGETTQQVMEFYRAVIQNLHKWTPRPPKLPDDQEQTSANASAGSGKSLSGAAPTPSSDSL